MLFRFFIYNIYRYILYTHTHIYTYILFYFQHCEQIRVYQTCLSDCALNVLSWNVATILFFCFFFSFRKIKQKKKGVVRYTHTHIMYIYIILYIYVYIAILQHIIVFFFLKKQGAPHFLLKFFFLIRILHLLMYIHLCIFFYIYICIYYYIYNKMHMYFVLRKKEKNNEMILSMGIVGVKSTAGREVKFIDPSKTTRSESA